jgi:hypothetical protein
VYYPQTATNIEYNSGFVPVNFIPHCQMTYLNNANVGSRSQNCLQNSLKGNKKPFAHVHHHRLPSM